MKKWRYARSVFTRIKLKEPLWALLNYVWQR
jgi:hypothetical protein